MKRWLRPLLYGATATTLICLLLTASAYYLLKNTLETLPRLPSDPTALGLRPGTEIYASNGERIFTFNRSQHWVDLDQISPFVVQALIATEDTQFYAHRGIDIKALLGALRANLLQGFGARGGSTLTQQLVKHLFFSPRKTLQRKISEMLLSLQLESFYARAFPGTVTAPSGQTYPAYKNRLLELYLNTVFYGADAYGIADAAQIYFGCSAAQLDLPRAALLMGIINAPGLFNPLLHPERATQRLQHVLTRLQRAGLLSGFERRRLQNVKADDLIDPHRLQRNPTPYWIEAIKTEVGQRWGADALRYGALRIHTTLDIQLQRSAEEAVAWGVARLDHRMNFPNYEAAPLEQRKNYVQAALLCLDPHSGQVRAMIGGRDIFISYFNRALAARRQPGSAFKTLAYLAALETGAISPLSLFVDELKPYEVNGKDWIPRNYGDHYLGLTTAAWALINSANSTAVQITNKVGPDKIVALAQRLGFKGKIGPYPSIALGVNEVTLLEMASAYGALAASGLLVEPTLLQRVVDAEGDTLFAHTPQITQALSPDLAYQMLHLLRQVIDRGTGRSIRRMGFSHPAAGKTGTTNDNTDAWFVGTTPDLATSIWVGFDQRRQHKLVDTDGKQITGGSGAAPIWAKFMREVYRHKPATDFQKPPGMRLIKVDPHTGTAPAANLVAIRPISIALNRDEQTNAPAAVLDFEAQYHNSLIDSTTREMWQNTILDQ